MLTGVEESTDVYCDMTSTETLLDTKDFIEKNQDETFQLSEQHDVFKASMGGKLVIAPVDFSKPGLRILDCGTADGMMPNLRKASCELLSSLYVNPLAHQNTVLISIQHTGSLTCNGIFPALTLILTSAPMSLAIAFHLQYRRIQPS